MQTIEDAIQCYNSNELKKFNILLENKESFVQERFKKIEEKTFYFFGIWWVVTIIYLPLTDSFGENPSFIQNIGLFLGSFLFITPFLLYFFRKKNAILLKFLICKIHKKNTALLKYNSIQNSHNQLINTIYNGIDNYINHIHQDVLHFKYDLNILMQEKKNFENYFIENYDFIYKCCFPRDPKNKIKSKIDFNCNKFNRFIIAYQDFEESKVFNSPIYNCLISSEYKKIEEINEEDMSILISKEKELQKLLSRNKTGFFKNHAN